MLHQYTIIVTLNLQTLVDTSACQIMFTVEEPAIHELGLAAWQSDCNSV